MSPLTQTGRDDRLALRHDVAAVRSRRDVVRARGDDAVSYLQGQLSQDLGSLEPGRPTRALVLEPGGKVDAWVRVWGRGDDEVLLDVEAGEGRALLDRLDRFRLRVRVDLELADWSLVSVRGPATPPPAEVVDAAGAELFEVVDRAGLVGIDLLGPELDVPAGIRKVGPDAFDAVRIEAGVPAMGTELGPAMDPLVIPAEAGEWLVEESVSFTKGCYVGQELVARVDSRGSNTPRKLRGIVGAGDDPPPRGAEVVVDGTIRGTVTSSGWSAELDAPVALSYVHRSVAPGAEAELRWGGGEIPVTSCPAQVRPLPLVGD